MSLIKQILASLAVVLLGGLGLAAFAPAAAAAPAPDSTSWTVRTAPNQYGSGRSLFGYTVNAGDELADGIDIANKGSDPITLKIYAADGFTTNAGGFDVLTGDKQSKDLGTWVKPAVSSITIAVGQQVQVPFSIAVPENATPGDHVGGIVTELDQTSDGASGDTAVHPRVGLRIKVRVSGELTPQLKIENVKLDLDGTSNPFGTGEAIISYTVHNTGNTVLSALQKVTVSGAFGRSSKTIDGKRLPELLPGEKWTGEVRVDEVHAMLWVSGKMTVTPVLTDAAGSTSTLNPIMASTRSFVSIWSFVVLIVLVLVLAAVVWLLIRLVKRRRGASKTEVDAKVAAAVEEG